MPLSVSPTNLSFDSVGDGMSIAKVLHDTQPLREVRRVFYHSGPFAGLWLGTTSGWVRALDPSHASFLPTGAPQDCRWWNRSPFELPIFADCTFDAPRLGRVGLGRSVAVRGIRQGPSSSVPPPVPPLGGGDAVDSGSSGGVPSQRSSDPALAPLCWLRVSSPHNGWVILGDGSQEVYLAPERIVPSVATVFPEPLMWVPVRSSSLALAVEEFGSSDTPVSLKPASTSRRSSRAVLSLSKSFAAAASEESEMTNALALRRVISSGLLRPNSISLSGSLMDPASLSPTSPFANPSPTPTFSLHERGQALNSTAGFEAAGWQATHLARHEDSERYSASAADVSASVVSPDTDNTPRPVTLCAYRETDEASGASGFVTAVRIGDNAEYTFNSQGIVNLASDGCSPSRLPTKQYTMGETTLTNAQLNACLDRLRQAGAGTSHARDGTRTSRRPFVPHSFDAAAHNSHTFCEAMLSEVLKPQASTAPEATTVSRLPEEITVLPKLSNGAVPPALSRRLSAVFTRR